MALNQTPIRVFNSALNFRAEVNLYESSYFQRLDYGIGEFEIQVNLNIPAVNEFVTGSFVQFDYDIKKIGIIIETVKKIGEKGKGDQILIVKGKEAKYIFSQRLIIPPAASTTYKTTSNAETALKTLIAFQAGSICPDTNRRLTNFEIDTDQGRGISYYINERNSTLSDIVGNLCLACEMGYYIYLDEIEKKLRLEVNFGKDHTAEQTVNGQVLFSTERNTIRSGEITESNAAYKNVCYVAGDGQGTARTIRLVYSGATEPTGWNRRETLLDAKQIVSTSEMDAAGSKRLNETQYTVFANGQFLNYSSYVYGKNFNLGDYVTIKIYDVQQNVKITGVRESWSNGHYEIDFEYDRSYPKFDSVVTSRINGIQGILNNTEPLTIAQVTALASVMCPIGSILAWHKSFPGTPALPANFVECNGQVLNDIGSVYNGQTIPDLNGGGRFLRGASTSGTLQADAFQGHKHRAVSSAGTAGTLTTPSTSVNTNPGFDDVFVDNPYTDGINGTPRTASETRPVNMSVVWVMRVK
jgi:hypothetical protein